ncbi:glycosyltransferase family 32 protein [Dothistroma septosporum NZE10]|uniref:Glycosyltransferase family 32 protein n=1 Tax=Dothistroma septosporum (strain NZE10 / CBS 128990) TaxID=675120 RepID=N1PR90_DOTSN|nr:glycosyltransferase family 32 protein [Dothistroma septosporum NZE10]
MEKDKSRKVFKHGRNAISRVIQSRNRTLAIFLVGCVIFFGFQAILGWSKKTTFKKVDIFPRKIWQSWKVDALSFEDRDSERARAWTTKNPLWRYEVLTDGNAISYVEHHFGPNGMDRPDIVSTYKALDGNRIIQADLLRYIIMFTEGGVWADIDAEAILSIDYFIPSRFNEKDVDVIIGIETDEPQFKDHPILGTKAQSFVQWTFLCKPGHPAMMRLINNILTWLNNLAVKQGRGIYDLVLDFDEVLSGTGPSAFTDAIIAEMSAITGKKITWDTFHDMSESTLIGGVLVLPSEAFAAGTGHSKSGVHSSSRALVKHHFHASDWTSKHPRHKHPIYGEVERCNWNIECVELWDANTAFFDSLPEKEQMEMIGIKYADAHMMGFGQTVNAPQMPFKA